MASQRRWSQWPAQVIHELNGVSGAAGLGGVALGAAGLALVTGPAALLLASVGTIVVVGTTGYAIFKGLPPLVQHPSALVGKTIDLEQLTDISPPIRTVSIIGPSQAGKTTLRNRLALEPSKVERTQRITAHISSLQTAPPSYLATLDGGGDRFAQQFRIAERCDCLYIVIDHNRSDSAPEIDQGRLEEHKEFFDQVRHHLGNL